MTTTHRLGSEWVMDHAAGTLNEGETLLVASHLSFVPDAASEIRAAEAVGGMLLDGLAPDPLADDALNRVLARLYEPEPAAEEEAAMPEPADQVLPAPLRRWLGRGDIEALKWSFLGPGMRKVVLWRSEDGACLWMLRAKAGTKVPRHGHGGVELTLVLTGSITDKSGTYRRGDVQEMNAAHTHGLTVGPEEECVCLAYTKGRMRFSGRIARMMQPFLGI
ncbi:MAG: ChrR family anti-sigma-E factor [Parvibaculum sp.]|uniref:ChrR family anti-sigma-E factor n=1 Tax=Parvibaculum sp. TaxID=2024848 RepID=UPI0025DA5488|nr:ChrR family anti-sigma-E factor [Parvibaculum sp.]MCE9649075.1 ChrR family anti-sigma-E factor [Parvibaculum sp.]